VRRGVLLDSHVLLWSVMQTPRVLGIQTKVLLVDPLVDRYVSVASLWELSIKKSIGKLDFPDALIDDIIKANITLLNIESSHLKKLMLLPHHHGDPFDRLLIAQAQAENLTLITSDKNIPRYDVAVLVAAT
jgi:PIN domain nuclease of toxin-antitoxin system